MGPTGVLVAADRFKPFVLGRYQVLWPLGEGASGPVYLATVTSGKASGRRVALKVLHPRLQRVHELLVTQAKRTSLVHHANVARMLAAEKVETQTCLVREHVDGISLHVLLDALGTARRKLPPHIACHVASRVLAAMQAAHDATDRQGKPLGLVHGGVGPSHVVVSRVGNVLVTGFGVANVLGLARGAREPSLPWGAYRAPEARRGGVRDARGDVHAVGALLCHCLAGRLPEDGAWVASTGNEGGAALRSVLTRAVHPEARQRFESAAAFAAALEPHLGGTAPAQLDETLGRLLRQTVSPATVEEMVTLSQRATQPPQEETALLDSLDPAELAALRAPVEEPLAEVVAGDLGDEAALLLGDAPAVDDKTQMFEAPAAEAQDLLLEPVTGAANITLSELALPSVVFDPGFMEMVEAPRLVAARLRPSGTWKGKPFTFSDVDTPATAMGARQLLTQLAGTQATRDCVIAAPDTPPRTGVDLGPLLCLDHLSLFPGLGDEPRHKGTTNTERFGPLMKAYNDQAATGVFSLLGPRPEHYSAWFIVDGKLQYICLAGARDSLLTTLTEWSALDDDRLNLLLATLVVDGDGLFPALAAQQLVPDARVQDAMVKLSTSRLEQILTWRQCRFEFRPGVRLPYQLPAPVVPLNQVQGLDERRLEK